jgi:hypothetical protein
MLIWIDKVSLLIVLVHSKPKQQARAVGLQCKIAAGRILNFIASFFMTYA